MKRLLAGMGCALLFVSGPRAAVAQETKTVSGAVTAIAANSITVKSNGTDMTFVVDAKTHTTAPGGTTKMKAAQAEGKPGIAITEVVKVGQDVEVTYHEKGMHAASVRVLTSVPKGGTPPPPPPAPAAKPAIGVVSAVSGSSLTVKGTSAEWTFVIDAKTHVTAPGGTTKTKAAQAEGKPGIAITEVVRVGQDVEVTYHEMGGMKHATEVRVTKKGT